MLTIPLALEASTDCVHDLRGTAATHYILAGLPLDDVATILGWELRRVTEIARCYVTGEAIGMGMIARLQ